MCLLADFHFRPIISDRPSLNVDLAFTLRVPHKFSFWLLLLHVSSLHAKKHFCMTDKSFQEGCKHQEPSVYQIKIILQSRNFHSFMRLLKNSPIQCITLLVLFSSIDLIFQRLPALQFEMKPTVKAPTLQLEILTWEKDSHGLFDYEATRHAKEYFEIQGPCKLFRNWHQAQTSLLAIDKVKRGQLPQENFHFLASLSIKHNGNSESFILQPPERPSQQVVRRDGGSADEAGPINTHAYIVVRYYRGAHRSEGYPLSLGNVVKLGRVEYRVVEIGGVGKRGEGKSQPLLGEFNGVHQAAEAVGGNCKFCLCDDSTPDNFLISPCKCKGSCEGVHVQCLKMWIDSKVKKEVTGMVVSYNFTKFQCEICKEPFPRVVTRPACAFTMEMISIDKPKTPYLILEGMNERKESKEERCLHVVCPQGKNTVKMGRGHQCQIRLQDISVSRLHSEIKFEGGDFYVNDLNSKFGTLIRLDRGVELGSKVKLQVGRSLYKFQIE